MFSTANAADGYFSQYKLMQKKSEKYLKPCQIDAHLRVLGGSYQMNTNMTGFRWFSQTRCIFVLWTKVALAL